MKPSEWINERANEHAANQFTEEDRRLMGATIHASNVLTLFSTQMQAVLDFLDEHATYEAKTTTPPPTRRPLPRSKNDRGRARAKR